MFSRILGPALALTVISTTSVSLSAQTQGTGIARSLPRPEPDCSSDRLRYDDGRAAGRRRNHDVICGDKDFWVISPQRAHVKPAKDRHEHEFVTAAAPSIRSC